MSEVIGGGGVLDEGIAVGGKILDFVGAGVTATVASDKVTVSIPGGGGTSKESHVSFIAIATEVTF